MFICENSFRRIPVTTLFVINLFKSNDEKKPSLNFHDYLEPFYWVCHQFCHKSSDDLMSIIYANPSSTKLRWVLSPRFKSFGSGQNSFNPALNPTLRPNSDSTYVVRPELKSLECNILNPDLLINQSWNFRMVDIGINA